MSEGLLMPWLANCSHKFVSGCSNLIGIPWYFDCNVSVKVKDVGKSDGLYWFKESVALCYAIVTSSAMCCSLATIHFDWLVSPDKENIFTVRFLKDAKLNNCKSQDKKGRNKNAGTQASLQ